MRLRVRLLVSLALVLVARGAFAASIPIDSAFQIRYVSNLAIGDSFVNFTNPVTSPDPTPVTPVNIVAWSASATGAVAFDMSSTDGSSAITCGIACFDVSPTGLSMQPGYFVKMSRVQGEGQAPTMSLTPTGDPVIIRGTWYDANNPGVVASAEGPIPAVPEPATLTLVGLGVVGVAFTRRRR